MSKEFDLRDHKKAMFVGIVLVSLMVLFGVFQLMSEDPLLSIFENSYTVEIIEGVKTINNHEPKLGTEPIFELEFVRRIGELDSEDENLLFFVPKDIVVDKDKNIYVLDSGNHRIQKFDPDLNFIASIGRKGQGPAEFNRPLELNIDDEGNIFVLDNGNFLIMGISPEGKEIKRIRLSRVVFPHFLVSNTGNIMYPMMTDSSLLTVYDAEDSIVKEFGDMVYYENYFLKKELNNNYPVRAPDGSIYLVFTAQNRIDKYTPEGELIFRTKRSLNFEETVDPEYDLYDQTVVLGGEWVDLVLADVTYTKIVFMGENISRPKAFGGVDSEGRLWVAAHTSQPEPIKFSDFPDRASYNEARQVSIQSYIQFEVFDSEGVLLGYLPLPDDPVPTITTFGYRVFHDRVYIIDMFTEMSIFEYRIVENF